MNQKRYETVFNEILQYLTTYQSELSIQVQGNRFLTFQSLNSSLSECITLPLSSLYLHTCYFKLHTGFQLCDEDKKFASVAWEVLNILKENFPSKIHLSQDNLEMCKPAYVPMTAGEELRRQISCLMSIREEDRFLTQDEIEDAWHTLTFAEKQSDQRSLNMCLEIVNNQTQNWQQAYLIVEEDTLKKLVMKNDYTQLTSNKIIAQDILDKLQVAQKSKPNNETLVRDTEDSRFDEGLSMGNDTLNGTMQQTSYEKPSSTRMCLFQLSESNDINRVTMILETLSLKSKETLSQLRKKYNLSSKLFTILKKYCNADYGFDQLSSRQGSFQFNILKLLTILCQDYVVFLDCLQSNMLDFLCQIIEEGVIYAYEDALSGVNSSALTSNTTKQYTSSPSSMNSDLYKFLKMSLNFVQLAISKQYQEYLPNLRTNLTKIEGRMQKLLTKKENAMLNYFIQNYQSTKTMNTAQEHDKPIEQQQFIENSVQNTILEVTQLQELKGISESLYNFAIDLNSKIQKVEALLDSDEEHEEKYRSLFFEYVQSQPYQTAETDNLTIQERGQQKSQLPNKVQFIVQARDKNAQPDQQIMVTNQSYDNRSKQYDTTYQSQKENVFLNNQMDDRWAKDQIKTAGSKYERDSFESNQSSIPQREKVTPNHYIGSPYKPLKPREIPRDSDASRKTSENRFRRHM